MKEFFIRVGVKSVYDDALAIITSKDFRSQTKKRRARLFYSTNEGSSLFCTAWSQRDRINWLISSAETQLLKPFYRIEKKEKNKHMP